MSNPFFMDTNTKTPKTMESLEERCLSLEDENAKLAAKVEWYEQQFKLSQQKRFGASSEKMDPDQISFFDEAEVTSDTNEEEPTLETIEYKRKKRIGQREEMLKSLPTETVEYHLEDQACSSCGHDLHQMSTEERRELIVIPAQVKVKKHVRHVYSCRRCERHGVETPVQTAPMPNPVLPKSLASPSSLAFFMSQKYVEALPLYRQEKQLERMGIPLSRATIANWMIQAAHHWLKPLFDQLHQAMVKHSSLHADETPLQVLREDGKAAESKSYMWLYCTGRNGPPIVLYDYQRTRAGKHAKRFLESFSGYLQTDGYGGYHKVDGVQLMGCWAHARRKFDEALKAAPSSSTLIHSVAKEAIQKIQRLYAIEKESKTWTDEERLEYRKKKSEPILEDFSKWLKNHKSKVLPKSKLGEAITYCLNQWDQLVVYLQDGQIDIDNNRAERFIKPFVIGRKNWLFSNSLKGAESSAMIYSVVETAKANGLNPLNYLTYLFEQLPQMDLDDPEAWKEVLPWSSSLPGICHVPKK